MTDGGGLTFSEWATIHNAIHQVRRSLDVLVTALETSTPDPIALQSELDRKNAEILRLKALPNEQADIIDRLTAGNVRQRGELDEARNESARLKAENEQLRQVIRDLRQDAKVIEDGANDIANIAKEIRR